MTAIRLLIVDDDVTMLMMCRRFFERSPPPRGIAISEAESGEQAIEMLRDNEYECVISDYRMGAVTGIDVLAFVMEKRPKAVRIIMSGFASPKLVMAATAEARVHEFIEKPMTSRELEAILRETVLERYLNLIPPVQR
jgi:DNA-binding NtrC family response regulator